MVMVDIYKIPVAVSLGVVASILTLAVLASLWRSSRLPPTPKPEFNN
jgi:tellurite resistance protein TerC